MPRAASTTRSPRGGSAGSEAKAAKARDVAGDGAESPQNEPEKTPTRGRKRKAKVDEAAGAEATKPDGKQPEGETAPVVESGAAETPVKTPTHSRKRKAKVEEAAGATEAIKPDGEQPEPESGAAETPAKKKRASRSKKTDAGAEGEDSGAPRVPDDVDAAALARFQRHADLARRTGLYIGAHVSAQGGVEKAVWNAVKIGAPCFGVFVRNQRQWNPAATPASSVAAFRALMNLCGTPTNVTSAAAPAAPPPNPPFPLPFDPLAHVLPHGSYLVNLGSPDAEASEKSYAAFLDELRRCEALGVGMYNFHPGSCLAKADEATRRASVKQVSALINRAHRETSFVKVVVENSAGGGGCLGVRFEEIGEIVKGVEDKGRIGVCLDTCHAFAAGYDLSTDKGYAAAMNDFERHIGFSHLCALHLNDSKAPLGSGKDRHENIGRGHLGAEAFRRVVRDPRMRGKTMILETPAREHGGEVEVYGREIEMLYGMLEDKIDA